MGIDIFTDPAFANGTYATTAATQIPYLMLHRQGQGIGESWTPQLVNGDYVCIVRWQQRYQFAADMIGTHTKATTTFHRVNPQPHVWKPNLYCVGLQLLESLGELQADLANAGASAYDYAVYKATFSPLPYELGSDDEAQRNAIGELTRYVERDRQDIGEAIQYQGGFVFPANAFPYAESGSDVMIPTPPAIMVSYSKLAYTQYYVPGDAAGTTPGSLPGAYVQRANRYYGMVNSVPFDNYYTAGPNTTIGGTVLYLGLTKQERLPGTPSGNVLWKMTHALAYRAQGWNVAYRPGANPGSTAGTPDWQVVVNRTTRLPPYGSTDLNQLFNP